MNRAQKRIDILINYAGYTFDRNTSYKKFLDYVIVNFIKSYSVI
jgi:hypothetical protein